MSTKADYVRSQGQSRTHHCHWPGCEKQVPPAMWGCKTHWFKLPANLRAMVWSTYRPGQHPWLSTLWDEFGLRPKPRQAKYIFHADAHGGYLMPVDLFQFGFQAKKRTGIYMVGCRPSQAPAMPMRLGEATHTIGLSGRDATRRRVGPRSPRASSIAPLQMAEWLVELARRSKREQ